MKATRALVLGVLLGVSLTAQPRFPQSETLRVPTFGEITVYTPTTMPSEAVLFLSGEEGWTGVAVAMAELLRDQGAMVVGIDGRAFRHGLEAAHGCAYPAGDLEELARSIQLRQRLPNYLRPVVVGYSSGASLAYAALASAPSETFKGGLSVGFCPTVTLATSLCAMRGLHVSKTAGRRHEVAPFRELSIPWLVLEGDADRTCSAAAVRQFVTDTGSARLFSLPGVDRRMSDAARWSRPLLDAYRSVAVTRRPDEASPASAPDIADLSLVEVPSTSGAHDQMAVILTGDGGWAQIDKGLARGLAAAGVATVGWSSLRYFWTPRTPEQAAADLTRIISHYTRTWGRREVVLVGYSFGADVLPFLATRLPLEIHPRVASIALLGISETASFEFHVAEWLGRAKRTNYRTVPEVDRLTFPVTCVRGEGETDSACRLLHGANVTTITIGAGHHFSNDYPRLVEAILHRR